MKHLNITIKGQVQRVGFRLSTKVVADMLSVRGFVINQQDGSVYLEAEGDEISIKNLLQWCHEGPEKAKVESVHIEESTFKNYINFEVLKKKPDTVSE